MAASPEPSRADIGRTRILPAFLLAGAVLVAGLSFAATLRGVEAQGDTAYLTVLTTLVLAALAPSLGARSSGARGPTGAGSTFGSAPRSILAIGAGLAVLSLWTLPVGPTRYALLFAVLVSLLFVAALMVIATVEVIGRTRRTLPLFSAFYPLCVAAQLLLRPERWLAAWTDPRTLISLLGLPALVALALALLAGREGARPAVVAVSLALLLAPGITVLVALALLGLAAGREALERIYPGWARLLVAAVLPALILWQPRAAIVLGLGALCLLIGRREWALGWLQAFTGLLFFVSALLAAPPWLRPEPLRSFFDLVGVGGLALLVALPLGYALVELWRARRPSPGHPPGKAVAGSTWAVPTWAVPVTFSLILATHLAQPATVVEHGRTLPPERPIREHLLAGGPVAELVLDSRLTHAASLSAGTPVLTLRAIDAEGREHVHRLRAGIDTGEWAARRPDVAAYYPLPRSAAWRGQLATPGAFFGQSYRSTWQLPEPARIVRLRLERSSSLPPGVQVQVDRLELRR